MKQKHRLFYISILFSTACKKYLLPALAIGSIAACNSANGTKAEKNAEKVIALPAITQDTTSVHNNLKQKLPYRYAANDSLTVDIIADSAKLHIKNDSCWIEYTSNVIVHKKQKDGSEKTYPAIVGESTDTVAVK